MPNIYITDETKKLIEEVMVKDCRTQDGEILYLAKQRLQALRSQECEVQNTTSAPICQEKSEAAHA